MFLNNKVRVHDARAALEYSKLTHTRPYNSILKLIGQLLQGWGLPPTLVEAR